MGSVNEGLITALREALSISPDNVPLRKQLAVILIQEGSFAEAEVLLREGLTLALESEQLKIALADSFARQGKVSEALVIVEDLAARLDAPPTTRLLLGKLLLQAGDKPKAVAAYLRAIKESPEIADEAFAQQLGVAPDQDAFDDEDEDVDSQGRMRLRNHSLGAFVPVEMEKPSINFDDVGGMDAIKEEIRLKIIAPLENAELYKAYGKAIGGGVLMYGPPGCGKTYLARAAAGQINAGFISVGIHDILDMYVGQSEQKLHALFDYARSHAPCVLFFDEVDALGAKRSEMHGSAGRHVINQFLAELDGVQHSNAGLLILAATNAPWSLDSAFRRPGRFDRILFVPPPDAGGGAAILRVLLKNKPQKDVDCIAVAAQCVGFSGADYKGLVDRAIEEKLRDAMKTGIPEPIMTKDLLRAAKLVRPSTREWFATARNYALYSNAGGEYDDVLNYLKVKR